LPKVCVQRVASHSRKVLAIKANVAPVGGAQIRFYSAYVRG
jgi:hypothetical protein